MHYFTWKEPGLGKLRHFVWVGRAGPRGAKIQMDQVTAEYKEGGFKTGAQKGLSQNQVALPYYRCTDL